MIKFNTPNTKVKWLPMNITPVAGWSLITGTAMVPQLSPAMTVLNRSRLAFITEFVELMHSGQSGKYPSPNSSIIGYTNSTMSIAQKLITPKQMREDHSRAFMQVAIIVSNLRSSLRDELLRRIRVRRRIRATLSNRRIPMRPKNSVSPTAWRIVST
eukprot:Skav212801  [mRNA]  locus=scaffold1633:122300:134194:+ [translate_table: standard]